MTLARKTPLARTAFKRPTPADKPPKPKKRKACHAPYHPDPKRPFITFCSPDCAALLALAMGKQKAAQAKAERAKDRQRKREHKTVAQLADPVRKPPDPAYPPPKRTTRGMKGRTPTANERAFMDLAGALPCLACLIDGRENHHISLHHIQGRTAPGAHLLVLPLCAQHHLQDDSDPLGRMSVHGRKSLFTARYGTELELLAKLRALLGM